MAILWPRGLRLLFELAGLACDSIIDARDSAGHSAICCAIDLQQVESVRILLDHDAPLDLEHTGNFSHPAVLYLSPPRKVFEVLSNELSCRRRQLLSIALKNLPDTCISKLGLRSVSMIQTNATEVIDHLKLQHVDIPQICHGARPGTIYHSPKMSVTLAESLFRAGFTEVDFLIEGYSPLMTIEPSAYFVINGVYCDQLLPLINFFVEQGADIHRPIPHNSCSICPRRPRQIQVVHRLAYVSGTNFNRDGTHIPPPTRLRESDQLSLRRVLASRSADPCLCYCTSEGCSPASNFIKGFLSPNRPEVFPPRMWEAQAIPPGLPFVLASFQECVTGQDYEKCVYDVVRVCTFAKLGMHHTCCSYRRFLGEIPRDKFHGTERCGLRVMEPAEVAEIQEEDRHTAEHLEMLMAEFEARLQSHPEPLDHFVSGYWLRRMSQVEAEREQIGDDDIQAMRDIGVRFK